MQLFFFLLNHVPTAILSQYGDSVVGPIHIVGRLAVDTFAAVWLQGDGLGIADGVVRLESQDHAIFCRWQVDGIRTITA